MSDSFPDDLPRLLVFSALVPETRSAGALLLYRLLKHYPSEKLLVLGRQPHAESEILSCRYLNLPDVWFSRLYRTRYWKLVRSLATFGVGRLVSVRKAEKYAEGFQPQVVLTVMEESQYYGAASHFSARNGIPLVLLVHDLVELFEPVYGWASARQKRQNAAVCRLAKARMCISPEMARHVQFAYGVAGEVLYPNRSEELMPRAVSDSAALRRKGRLTIGYAGGLSYGYSEGIRAILPALREARVTLRVYSIRSREEFGDEVEHAGFAPSPQHTWERIKDECDVVLLPYCWQPDFKRLYEAHFPSKLPEYLALGMPILIVGPAYAAGVAWGLKNPRAALTVSEPSKEFVSAACIRLREDATLRNALALGAIEEGGKDFDPVAIREKFEERLKEVAFQPRNAILGG